MKIIYLHKVWIIEIYISLSQLIDGILSTTERKIAKQSLIGRIRTNPDLGSI